MFQTVAFENIVQMLRSMLDVFTLSVLFYFLYRLFRVVKIPLLFNHIGLILLLYVVASLFKLETVLWLLSKTFNWGIIGAIIVFHPELRAFVMRSDYAKLFRRGNTQETHVPNTEILKDALEYLIGMKRGALFVFSRHINLEYIITSKVEINAGFTTEMLKTIFGYDTVLHDGAILIQNNRITHAGCFLPIDRNATALHNLGSRHRAALGLSQNSDAVILVLSEEFGSVSLVYDGEILYDIGVEKSCAFLVQLLQEQSTQEFKHEEQTATVQHKYVKKKKQEVKDVKN